MSVFSFHNLPLSVDFTSLLFGRHMFKLVDRFCALISDDGFLTFQSDSGLFQLEFKDVLFLHSQASYYTTFLEQAARCNRKVASYLIYLLFHV